MSDGNTIHEIKFSKSQALVSFFVLLALLEPFSKMIKQGMAFREYYWFAIVFIVAAYVFWNIIRVTVLMIVGVPAIVISHKTITLTQKGYAIEWKDIDEMEMVVTGGKGRSYNLAIKVKEPWKYIAAIKNPVSRYYCWYAMDYFYRPFTVNLSMLEGDNYQVYNMIESYYHTYRRLAA